MTDRERSNDTREGEEYGSAFPDTDSQLSPGNTVVDEPVREGLDNAVENSQVRTRDGE